MMENVWSGITSWFQDVSDRKVLVREFNNAAKAAYISGLVPCLVKCNVSKGYKPYKHSNSAFYFSGIRFTAQSNEIITEEELNILGLSILGDSRIVRLLITLGWDTLEVVSVKNDEGLRWCLTKFAK